MTVPRHGPTVRAHVEGSLASASATLIGVMRAVQAIRRIRPAEREGLRRDLAGVISDCESVRVWLEAGCQE